MIAAIKVSMDLNDKSQILRLRRKYSRSSRVCSTDKKIEIIKKASQYALKYREAFLLSDYWINK